MSYTQNVALSRFLQRLSLRSTLSEAERATILSLPGQVVSMTSRRDLASPGSNIDHATLVAEGIVARFDQMRDGSRQIVALYIAGDMCDLHSVPSPVTVWGLVALAHSAVVQVPHASLKLVAERHPAIGLAFWRDTVVDASVLAKTVAIMGRLDARARTAHLLCELGYRSKLAGLGERDDYPLPATQDQISDVLGMTPVHVNRMLNGLRRDGIAEARLGRVRITDLRKLERLADFDTSYLMLNA